MELASVARLGGLAAVAVLVMGAVFAVFVVQHKGGWPMVQVRDTRVTVEMSVSFPEAERRYIRNILPQKRFYNLGITSIEFPDSDILQIHTSERPETAKWEQTLLSALSRAHELAVSKTQRHYDELAEEATTIRAILDRSGPGEDRMLAELLDRRLAKLRVAMEPIAARLERWRVLNVRSIERENLRVSQKLLLVSHMVITLVAAICVGFIVGYTRSLLRSRE